MGLSEKPHRRLGVVHPAKDRFLQRRFQVEEVVDAQAVAEGGGDVPHAGEVFAQRHHVRSVVAAGEKKPTVRHKDHGAIRDFISRRKVDVHVELFHGSRRANVAAVDNALLRFDLVKHPVAVSRTVALRLGLPSATTHKPTQKNLTHGRSLETLKTRHPSRDAAAPRLPR